MDGPKRSLPDEKSGRILRVRVSTRANMSLKAESISSTSWPFDALRQKRTKKMVNQAKEEKHH